MHQMSKYIGHIINVQKHVIPKKFIRKKEPSINIPHNFKWQDKDDVAMVSRDCIVATLAKPQTDR